MPQQSSDMRAGTDPVGHEVGYQPGGWPSFIMHTLAPIFTNTERERPAGLGDHAAGKPARHPRAARLHQRPAAVLGHPWQHAQQVDQA
jgi:hypothetical protein